MKCVQPVYEDDLSKLPHVGDVLESRFKERGMPTYVSVAMAGVDAIKAVPGVQDHRAHAIWSTAVGKGIEADLRGHVDDLCEVGAPFTEAESADLARAGVHTFEQMSNLTPEQLVEITGVSAVDAAAGLNKAKFLYGQLCAKLALMDEVEEEKKQQKQQQKKGAEDERGC